MTYMIMRLNYILKYKYIDHPEGYSYDELLSMPPEDMTFSKYFIKYKRR